MPRETFEDADGPLQPATERDQVAKIVLEGDPTQVTDVTDEDIED